MRKSPVIRSAALSKLASSSIESSDHCTRPYVPGSRVLYSLKRRVPPLDGVLNAAARLPFSKCRSLSRNPSASMRFSPMAMVERSIDARSSLIVIPESLSSATASPTPSVLMAPISNDSPWMPVRNTDGSRVISTLVVSAISMLTGSSIITRSTLSPPAVNVPGPTDASRLQAASLRQSTLFTVNGSESKSPPSVDQIDSGERNDQPE